MTFTNGARPWLTARATLAGVTAALLLCSAGLAQAAEYPVAGGSTFNAGPDGWTSAAAQCSPGGATLLCQQENVHEADAGTAGSGGIVARTTVLANSLELFRGDSTWRSPTFTGQAGSGASVLEFDRSFQVGGLAALSPRANVEAVLVDETAGRTQSLGTEELTDSDEAFATATLSVARGALVAGREYHLELRSTTTTSTVRVGVSGSAELHYDNVVLRSAPPFGASGSAGVTFPGAPLAGASASAFGRSLSLFAETGPGPGGSLVPLDRCTILGTPGNDRIKGTSSNDVICGLGGRDVINAGRGTDLIDGGAGNDRAAGASGNDTLLGLAGRDRLNGGAGKDRLGAGAAADRAVGGGGNDRIVGGRAGDRINAGKGRDRIHSRDRRRDRVNGGSGRDRAKVDRRGKNRRKRDVVRSVEKRR